jgi:hypothetical protein
VRSALTIQSAGAASGAGARCVIKQTLAVAASKLRPPGASALRCASVREFPYDRKMVCASIRERPSTRGTITVANGENRRSFSCGSCSLSVHGQRQMRRSACVYRSSRRRRAWVNRYRSCSGRISRTFVTMEAAAAWRRRTSRIIHSEWKRRRQPGSSSASLLDGLSIASSGTAHLSFVRPAVGTSG